jgi:hypothetical protein
VCQAAITCFSQAVHYLLSQFCCRLYDVVSVRESQRDLRLNLIFEHIDQDLAQYLERRGPLPAECIQVGSNGMLLFFSFLEALPGVMLGPCMCVLCYWLKNCSTGDGPNLSRNTVILGSL